MVATTGINGSAPFAERLQWDGQHLKFSDKILENPFERVSFDRLRPLIQNTDQLTIQKLSWREKSYGPLAGYFSLRQNMLLARQFDLDIGSGRTYGEMFLNLDPSAMRLGLLARLTALDLNKSLPASFLRNVPAGVNALNARAGLVLDIDKSTLDGRVDVGEMGGAQLIALINVFDPLYKNEKMNRARRALAVGYPTSMTLLFDNGFMGLDVAIRALGLSQSESVRGISIAKLLSSATADISLKAKKGILQ